VPVVVRIQPVVPRRADRVRRIAVAVLNPSARSRVAASEAPRVSAAGPCLFVAGHHDDDVHRRKSPAAFSA
jgi:hypothetical protein